jgi:hypothetical protein
MTTPVDNPYAAPLARVSEPSVVGRTFKFKFVNNQGREIGFLAKKGALRVDVLVLDGQAIPLVCVIQALVRLNRLVLAVQPAPGARPVYSTLSIVSGPRKGETIALGLKRGIDRAVSEGRATARLNALRNEGRGTAFRVETCRHCGATIDLSGFDRSPQAYCPYCNALVSADPTTPCAGDEADFHLCDKCGYYSRPAVFNSTVVVFLLVVVSVWSRRRFMCHTCMRKEAWVTFLKNVPTLIGTPFALWHLIGAYLGGSARSAAFQELDAANRLARDGRTEQAEALYQAILMRTPHAAGVHYNRALARADHQDWPACLDALNTAWADCANFSPALPWTVKALEALGRDGEAQALRARWQA